MTSLVQISLSVLKIEVNLHTYIHTRPRFQFYLQDNGTAAYSAFAARRVGVSQQKGLAVFIMILPMHNKRRQQCNRLASVELTKLGTVHCVFWYTRVRR